MRSWIASILLALTVVAGAVAALVWLQRRLLYHPVRQDLAPATLAARSAGLEPWPAADRFLGWRARSRTAPPEALALVLHGNAASALDRLYLRDVLQATAALDVVLLEYPGYGPREGTPSEASLVGAGREALARLQREGFPVVLVGESLGSAVAAMVAAAEPDGVAGLLLVTPLASVTAVARRLVPLLPTALVREPYRADLALPRYPGPVAFLVAGRDEVVFTDLGIELFRARAGPKRLWLDPDAGHNGVSYDPRDPRWREIVQFLGPGLGR